MPEQWIVIPGWEKFQHYKDRDPTWIKVYTELNSRDDWLGLSCGARGLLCTCWVEYARSRGRATTSHVLSLCGPGTRATQFKPLIDAGFIQVVASRPPHIRASPEKEKNKNKNYLEGHEGTNKPKPVMRPDKPEWIPNVSQYTGCRHIYNGRAVHGVYDPLGTDQPQPGWPHPKPGLDEIRKALNG